MKILFLVPYPKDCVPGQRLKFEQYLSIFEDNGIQYKLSPFISDALYKILYKKGFYSRKCIYTLLGYMRRALDIWQARKFDLVYIFLYAVPFGPPIFEYLLRLMKKNIVYDIDDTVFLPHSSEANRFTRYFKGRTRIQKIMNMADHVIVVTKYLENYAQKYNTKVTHIPPTMDTDKYFVKQKKRSNEVCIGWSGSHSTSQYLLLLEEVFRKIKQKYQARCKIKVIGDKNFKFASLDIYAIDWSLSREVEELQEIDIGLYPLPDCEWVLGKGGLKAIQYMALGIPPVCSRIGEALDIIRDGINGFLASSNEEWLEKISILIENEDLRKQMGQMARKTVEERYSLKANTNKYLDIFESLYINSK